MHKLVFVSGEEANVHMEDIKEHDKDPPNEPGPNPVTPSPTRANITHVNVSGTRQMLLQLLSGQHSMRYEVTKRKNAQKSVCLGLIGCLQEQFGTLMQTHFA